MAHGGHFVAQQAGQEGLKYLVTALFGSSHAPLLTALAGDKEVLRKNYSIEW